MEYLFLDTPELAQLGVMVVNRNCRGIKIAPGLDHVDQTLRKTGEEQLVKRLLPHHLAQRVGIITMAVRLDGIGHKDHHIERRHVAGAHRVTVDSLENGWR